MRGVVAAARCGRGKKKFGGLCNPALLAEWQTTVFGAPDNEALLERERDAHNPTFFLDIGGEENIVAFRVCDEDWEKFKADPKCLDLLKSAAGADAPLFFLKHKAFSEDLHDRTLADIARYCDCLARHRLATDHLGRYEIQVGQHSFYKTDPADASEWAFSRSHPELRTPLERLAGRGSAFREIQEEVYQLHHDLFPAGTQEQSRLGAISWDNFLRGSESSTDADTTMLFSKLFACATLTASCCSRWHLDKKDVGLSGQLYFGSFVGGGCMRLLDLRIRLKHGARSYIALAANELVHGSEPEWEGFRAMAACYLPQPNTREAANEAPVRQQVQLAGTKKRRSPRLAERGSQKLSKVSHNFDSAEEGSLSDQSAPRTAPGDASSRRKARFAPSAPEGGPNLVGERVSVFWDKEEKKFSGVVAAFEPRTFFDEGGGYMVRYDDGETMASRLCDLEFL